MKTRKRISVPSIHFFASYSGTSIFKEITAKSLRRANGKNSKFILLFRKNGTKLLNAISRFTGYRWNSKSIDVYIVEHFPIPAISSPLIINYYKDADYMLYLLVHELVHNNLANKEVLQLKRKGNRFLRKSHNGIEFLVSLVVKHIFDEFFPEKLDLIIKKETKKLHITMWKTVDKCDWDLNKLPLKTYIKNFA